MSVNSKPTGRLIILFLTLLIFCGLGQTYAAAGKPEQTNEFSEITAKGKVIAILAEKRIIDPVSRKPVLSQKLKIRITSGKYAGKEMITNHTENDNPVFNIKVGLDDHVIITIIVGPNGILEANISDLLRVNYLYILGVIFIILLLAIGWKMGAKSLCGLLITLFLIGMVLLPGVLKGYSPVLLTCGIAVLATTLTMLVVGGWTIKSLAAILGTLGGVIVAGTLALIFGKAAHLTGFGSEESAMLLYLPENLKLDIQGILFSGIIIGALGVCMDVSMSVASAIAEVKRTSPNLSGGELIRSGMNVGRDIMSTQANTLIMAYTGSSIQLILVFMAFKESLMKILNLDMVASEIVRAFTGSIGMLSVIPITAVIAGTFFGRNQDIKAEKSAEEEYDFWDEWKN
jgi:uncharacterized membrane protein